MRPRPRHVLPTIVLAQFAGTSLWFAGNAVLRDLQRAYALPEAALGPLTSAVQVGFIVGTLAFATLRIADRFAPSRVFLVSALLGAACNAAIGVVATEMPSILAARFLTGLFLAGIYPVGMKIAADWFDADLGRALGWLVGALVLGTAFPHLLRFLAADVPWQRVLQGASALAAAGGALLWATVPDGPHRARGTAFRPSAILEVFRGADFRSAAFGYFGHMWELYAFWAFVPLLLAARFPGAEGPALSLGAFAVIAAGAVGCVTGGYASLRRGSGPVAAGLLAVSGAACLASPLLFGAPAPAFALAVAVWGVAVAGDSPQFSTLVARTAPAEVRGSALTIVNSLGFAVTVPAIETLNRLAVAWPADRIFVVLAVGPILGLLAMRRHVAAGRRAVPFPRGPR